MGTKLINNSQVKSVLKIKGILGSIIAGAAMSLTGFNKINRIYSHISDFKGIAFADKLLSHLNVQCCYNPADLEYIPKEGALIVVANHPFGAIDGLIMLSVIGKIRPDIKVLTNFLLSYIPNLEEEFFPVNPFTSKPGLKSSLAGLKLAMEHLQSGGVLVLFPSGEVTVIFTSALLLVVAVAVRKTLPPSWRCKILTSVILGRLPSIKYISFHIAPYIRKKIKRHPAANATRCLLYKNII